MNWLDLVQGLIPVAVGIAQQIHGAKTGPQKLSTAASLVQTGLASSAKNSQTRSTRDLPHSPRALISTRTASKYRVLSM